MTSAEYKKLERLLKAALADTPDTSLAEVYDLQGALEIVQERKAQ